MKQVKIDQIKSLIPSIQGASQIEQIHKGYSNDQKFIIAQEEQKRMLLRVIDLEQYSSKKEEFQHLQALNGYGVKCPAPIDFGKIPELDACYMLLSYTEGEDASEVLPRYSEQTQYQIGVEAGRDLARIHQYQAPATMPSWFETKSKKHQNYVEAYKQCGIVFPYEQQVLAYIEENMKYMEDRPNLFQHDDFTCGNLIVKDQQYAGVIDFNRYDWGDPIHEFLKVGLFSCEISIPFCIGQIQGYYKHHVPEHFWQLYTLYLAMAIISSIVWNNKFFPESNQEMMARLLRVTEDHRGFESVKPVWFRE